jgi:hypothetical protein
MSEFENFLLCERILINVTTCQNERSTYFKGFKGFGAFKGLVEQKNARFTRFLKWPTRAKKGPIYTQPRQINYYFHYKS